MSLMKIVTRPQDFLKVLRDKKKKQNAKGSEITVQVY